MGAAEGNLGFLSLFCLHTVLQSRPREEEREILRRGETVLKEGLNFEWTQYLPPRNPVSLERTEIVKEKIPILSIQTGSLSKMSSCRKTKKYVPLFFFIYAHLIHIVCILIPLQIHQAFFHQNEEGKKCSPFPKLETITRLHCKFRKLPHSIYTVFYVACNVQSLYVQIKNVMFILDIVSKLSSLLGENGNIGRKIIPVLVIIFFKNVFTFLFF